MWATRLFLSAVLVLFAAGAAVVTAQSYLSWQQQTGNGPVNDRESREVSYTFDGSSLVLTITTDTSTPDRPLFMQISLRNYVGIGTYTLGTGTWWRYGQRTDQTYRCLSGTFNVTRVDSVKNRIYGTFNWFGETTTPSGITLNVRISNGQFDILVKPKLVVTANPKTGTKLKPKEDGKFTITVTKEITNTPVSNATVEIKWPKNTFENTQTTYKTNSSGVATVEFKVAKSVADGDYEITAKATKENYDDSNEEKVTVTIDASRRYWYAKCNGISWLMFDAGEDSVWEDINDQIIEADGPSIAIGGFIKCNGTMRINKDANSVTGNGQLYIPLSDGTQFTLYSGAFGFGIFPCGELLDLTADALVQKFTGGRIKDTKISITEGLGEISGAKLSFTIEGPKNLSSGCNPDLKGAIWQANKELSIPIELSFTREGSNYFYTAKLGVTELSLGPSFCLKEANIAYDSKADSLSLGATAKCPMFEEAGFTAYMKKQTLEGGSVSIKFNSCIPFPETPFCWAGGSAAIDNINSLNPFKMTLQGLFGVIGKPELCEFDIHGGVQFPPVVFKGGASVKFINAKFLSEKNPWQMEAGVDCEIDLDKRSITFEGNEKMLHLGGDYFLTGKTVRSLAFFNGINLTGSNSATLQIPKLSQENAEKIGIAGKFINTYTPLHLGTVTAALRLIENGEKTLSVAYDLNNATGALSAEAKELMSRIGKGTLTVDFTKLPSASAVSFDGGFTALVKAFWGRPGETAKGDNVQKTVSQEAVVPANSEMLMVMIDSKSADLKTTLTNPSGKTYNGSDEADSVLFSPAPEGNGITVWVVNNPAPGTWTISADNVGDSDSIAVYIRSAARPFAVTALQEGKTITATWDASGAPEKSTVSIFYYEPNTDYLKGIEIANVPESDGKAIITLADSTAPCEFLLWARRNDPTSLADAHIDGRFSNSKTYLLPPTNVTVIANQLGDAVVRWTPSPDLNVASYGIILRRLPLADTIIASAYGSDTVAEFSYTLTGSEQVLVKAFDSRGRAGCESQASTITVGVGEYAVTGDHPVAVYPNPTRGTATVTVSSDFGTQATEIVITDALGRVVATHSLRAGETSFRVNTVSMPVGTYHIVVNNNTNSVHVPLTVLR